MSVLVWNAVNENRYENGVDHLTLYTKETAGWKGVAWNGATSIDAAPEGGESEALWADNKKYATMRGAVSYAGTINCYQFPEEFNRCLGNKSKKVGDVDIYAHEQEGEPFRMAYRTALNDETNGRVGYRYHVVYGLVADPSDMTYETINDSPEAVEFSFDVEGTPISFGDITACEYTFDVYEKASGTHEKNDTNTTIKKILDTLFGSAEAEAMCPDPNELFAS